MLFNEDSIEQPFKVSELNCKEITIETLNNHPIDDTYNRKNDDLDDEDEDVYDEIAMDS